MMRRTVQVAGLCGLLSGLSMPPGWTQETPFQCRPLTCSSLTPTPSVDDSNTNDCAYRAGNLWWVDYVAGSLAWRDRKVVKPVIVAVFDDGAFIDQDRKSTRLNSSHLVISYA